ncbi:hypothetical protein V2J09_023791 [Rumex salicifolius]
MTIGTGFILSNPFSTSVVLGGLLLLLFAFIVKRTPAFYHGSVPSELKPVPKVGGRLPVLGNLLQLKEKKPFKTFCRWAEIYGPIYSIQLGSSNAIVLNSTDVAKEAMVTRFSSISTRKLSKALTILTYDKCMVATSDYNDFHKMAKRHILNNLLGSNALKRNRDLREIMLGNIMDGLRAHVKSNPDEPVNFRDIFEYELFALALKLAFGQNIESIHVPELGRTLSRKEVFHILVLDMMEGAIEVDWRDFFPYLRWVPNKVETNIRNLAFRREAVMKALMNQHKSQTEAGQKIECHFDMLLSEENKLTEPQIAMLLWEPIIESSDTTLVATEWALFQLAKDPDRQNRLYQELKEVCGDKKVSEEDLSRLPYLGAVFHETLRKHSPAPIVPIRYVHEDTQIGGYHVPAGSEIIINLYGCNMDKNQWENPEEWTPERFLSEKCDPFDLFKTMAFGAGKRVCSGSTLAMLVACVSVGRLVQEFEWRLSEGEGGEVDTVGLTTHSKAKV